MSSMDHKRKRASNNPVDDGDCSNRSSYAHYLADGDRVTFLTTDGHRLMFDKHRLKQGR